MALEIFRLARTLRPLKGVQFAARLKHALYRPKIKILPAPGLRRRPGPWESPVAPDQTQFGPGRFHFLNQAGDLNSRAAWNDPARDKLWLYNLHYFADLNATAAESRTAWHRSLIDRWIAENPPGTGNGWEPYPISLRIVNWVKYFLAGHATEPHWLQSLATQAQGLSQRLEYHLLGNHLLANAKALVYAGIFFCGPTAEAWRTRGLAILQREFKEQILSDGGHFELSPMYHAQVLEDILDLINIARLTQMVPAACVQEWEALIPSMLTWLKTMCHQDGEIAFFNDAAMGIAPRCDALEDYAARLHFPKSEFQPGRLWSLAASGYRRATIGDAVVIVDTARIGPDYIPGHAHADTLSFELSLGTERIIVNSGTSVYGADGQRQFERSTAAHSTVEISGQSSSEVWAGFRVGRKARIVETDANASAEAVNIWGVHDGYRSLKGHPLHRRSWRLESGRLTIEDRITNPQPKAVARFHLAPGITAHSAPGGMTGTLVTAQGRRLSWRATAPAVIRDSQWHPGFGKTVAAQSAEIMLQGDVLTFELAW